MGHEGEGKHEILEKEVQDNQIEEVENYRVKGRSWKAHSTAWARVPRHCQYNTSLEEILATTGENGEKRITWDFERVPEKDRVPGKELGTGETPKTAWELRERSWKTKDEQCATLMGKAWSTRHPGHTHGTWCITEKGPQHKWPHKIGKKQTPECHCQNGEQSGTRLAGECAKLTRARRKVDCREMEEEEWRTRHLRNKNK